MRLSLTMSNNGHRQLDWLERARLCAALAETANLGEARALLAREGLDVSPRVLAQQLRVSAEAIQYLRDSGLAPAFIGPSTRHARRIAQMDGICAYLDERLRRENPPLDRELAGLLQQYRELMSVLLEHDAPRGEGAAASAVDPRAAEEVASALNLLEALDYEQPPAGDSEHDLHVAARRLAAATGHAFAPAEPPQPSLAGAGRSL